MRVLAVGEGRVGWHRNRRWPLEGELTTLDIDPEAQPDLVAPADALPFEPETFDAVWASHILEHFPWARTGPVLDEWGRVLKQGGQLHLVLPDMVAIARRVVSLEAILPGSEIQTLIWGAHRTPWDIHHMGFCPNSIKLLLHRHHFLSTEVRPWHKPLEMWVVATKASRRADA